MTNIQIKYNILFFPDKEMDGGKSVPGAPVYKSDAKLRIRVRWAGSKVDFNVGYRVKLSQWDTKTQRCIAKTTNLQKQSASLINGRIQRYSDILEAIFKAAEVKGEIPAPNEVRLNSMRQPDAPIGFPGCRTKICFIISTSSPAKRGVSITGHRQPIR